MNRSWWGGALLALAPWLAQGAGPESQTPQEHKPAICAEGDCAEKAASGADALAIPTVDIVGQRASHITSQQIRQENLDIVDSVVADEIHKLPDIGVGEALQRIPGIQINRDRGESTQITIRGLSQVETLLNGREVFTAGSGRSLDFSDFPSEMISAINVYKTSSAEHIEGGIGGMVDLRTRRPFDFEGREVVVSGRALQGDLIDQTKPQFSILASDRWGTPGAGEFGALINLVHQERAWREDQASLGNYASRLMAGSTLNVPTSILESTSTGTRSRNNANIVLQWQPTEKLDLYAEANYTEFRTRQQAYQFYTKDNTPPTTFSGTPTAFSGTNDLQSIDWTNVAISTQGFARDTIDRTSMVAVGGSWTQKALTLKTDLSYTKSFNHLFYLGSVLNGTAAHLQQTLSTSTAPGLSASGTDLLNPATYTFAGLSYRTRPFDGDLKAAQLDAEYQFSEGWLDVLSAGLRYAERSATDAPGLIITPISYTAPATAASTAPNPYGNFFPGSDGVGNYLTGNISRDVNGLLNALGIHASIPTSNPLGTWTMTEKTGSGYLMGTFKISRLDGNAGIRIVHTDESAQGFSSQIAGTYTPLNTNSTYTDTLPSFNLRYQLGPGLYLRTAASKSLTRPDFNQLSPSLSLDSTTSTGSAGNPFLHPIRSNNFDLALEKYFSPSTSLYLTAFTKRVDGFLATTARPEIWNNHLYQVTRPYNSNAADIVGAEFGYQQFYDFLPGWLSGLGLQFNYTYLDSRSFNKLLDKDMPLQNISRNTYNLIGMYEKGPVSVRVAYNWRDKYLMDVTALSGIGPTPIYMKAYGWLDASASYRLSKQITLTLEGMNLLRTVRQSYYGVETRPKDSFINDRQVSAVITVQF
jgi:TonB-dependent receptor